MTRSDLPPHDVPETTPDDARLMAYADGELSGADAAAVARSIAADPDVARRVAVFAQTRARLAALGAAQDEVPEALRARVAATIAAHAAARARDTAPPTGGDVLRPAFGRRMVPAWPLALAASLALAVGLGAGFGAGIGPRNRVRATSRPLPNRA